MKIGVKKRVLKRLERSKVGIKSTEWSVKPNPVGSNGITCGGRGLGNQPTLTETKGWRLAMNEKKKREEKTQERRPE